VVPTERGREGRRAREDLSACLPAFLGSSDCFQSFVSHVLAALFSIHFPSVMWIIMLRLEQVDCPCKIPLGFLIILLDMKAV